MTAINWYTKVVKEYANFKGRARRAEYWYFVLVNVLISLILGAVGYAMNTEIIGNIYSLALFLPSIGVAIRRMHDIGKSGWFILIPIYNIVLLATEGDKGPNEYGPDPKNPETTFDFDNNKFA